MSWNTAADEHWEADNGVGDGFSAEPVDDSLADNGHDHGAGDGGGDRDNTCRHCHQEGHFARECPDKPAMTGECYNCGEVGHNKADCTNPKVDRPFTGTCNECGVEGHAARNCPTKGPIFCRICKQEGHKAAECKATRRPVDWTGIPELEANEAWAKLVDAAKARDLDIFRVALRAYARAIGDEFKLPDVAGAMRDDSLPVYLIAKQQEIPINMTIVDLIGNVDQEFVLTIQLSEKPRRMKMAQGWPETPEENMARLASAGFVQDRGIPLCSLCNELGHIRKHCKQEAPEEPESNKPTITCIYCSKPGHRARDCPEPRVNPYACKNCKQEGHNAKDCPEPRSAENVECRKCSQTGHFSRDCPNVEKPACRNCGSTEHMARECDQPRNPANTICRNCDQKGHFSRDCPEPKDWSKVTCSNCGQNGHTFKRCKEPAADDEGAVENDGGIGLGDPVESAGGWDAGGDDAGATAASNDWNAGGDSAGGW